ncbi:unnamed protein product [Brugia timori]|uniref:Ovule protein n=1 Tax=Brugia timori TaxID=42155 RepID=A0A0R3QBF5_9BILA|nr:unnamed protein product [Brugia timori]
MINIRKLSCRFAQRIEFVAAKQQVITFARYAMHLQLYFCAHKLFLTSSANSELTYLKVLNLRSISSRDYHIQ